MRALRAETTAGAVPPCPDRPGPPPQRASVPDETAEGIVDVRFRALVGEEGWGRLPPAVQRRFSKRLAPGAVLLYPGEVIEMRLSLWGRALSFLARAIGAPLPLEDGMAGGATVAVMENPRLGGQSWTRMYARRGRFPQVISSVKCFAGPTGLEEHVGCGIGMSLSVSEAEGALVFRSVGYFLAFGRLRVPLPRLVTPGDMEIVHRDEGGGAFLFTLALRHRRLGLLVSQTARFRDW